ncbi:hypothetical protein K443DRAFT_3509 [Laccaria amethystina LaAM-08-1]|uniref:Uncharacterized protein n=1 Tax=Laccaria amethystina LaAM-08-1 TaxID=1095629 RepID=A0A0C9XLQ2_9AGAR|nr:hypothetical protein K443DRAFT_3509 [Laccaria amethystina LaAM-08-1]
MFGSSLVNGSLGKGKDRPFDKYFDYVLELANHDEAWAKLEDPDTEKWLRKWVSLVQY